MSGSQRLLRIAAGVEITTLIVMLANLATVHWSAVSSLLGPTHGAAYLLVVVATAQQPAAPTSTRLLSLLPGVGGLLVLRALAAHRRPTPDAPAQS
ncbi:DUF3817 domain-containing protein [Micromonospora sp. LOL_021]|uniref:DUF3817 domain-containing protein n=1 Tax=Micromonospora sp. LOL_021 TaxID=3345417 RepID=UPI003A85D550